ncbi:MAG: sensor histidine kinase [Chloroflexota bacterium]
MDYGVLDPRKAAEPEIANATVNSERASGSLTGLRYPPLGGLFEKLIGLESLRIEWGVFAGRLLLAISSLAIVALSQDEQPLREHGIATAAVVILYSFPVLYLLSRGRIRPAVTLGLLLDTIVVGGSVVMVYDVIAGQAEAAGLSVEEAHELQHDIMRPMTIMVIAGVLRLRLIPGAFYAVSVPLAVALLGVFVGGAVVSVTDTAAHIATISAGGLAFLFVAYALQESRRRLAEAAEEKSMLISTVAHELRGPLTATTAYIDLVRDGSAGPVSDRQREILERAARTTKRLEEMISMFSQLRKAEGEEFPLAPDSVNLRALADYMCDQVMHTTRDRRVTLEIGEIDTLPDVRADRRSAEQILGNLLSNAIKHSPDDGVIKIQPVYDAGMAGLAVEDQGPGIRPSDQPYLFQRFYRSSDPERRKIPGTGLGLYVTRTLLERQHGEIWVEKSSSGGARFCFLLPVVDVPETSDAAHRTGERVYS